MAGLLSIAYPLPRKTWAIRFEGKVYSGIEVVEAETLAEAKIIARKRTKATKVYEWINPNEETN